MAQDFSELISYLDKKFASVESALEEKADKKDVQNLTTAIDGTMRRIETLNTEFISLSSKVNRLEGWVKLVAEKTETKLPT